ncbi:MAG: hypothetical protein ABJG15_05100 [Hyphomonadaceae bacterium]
MIRFFALLLVTIPLAHAQQQDAVDAYIIGDYREATDLASASELPDDLAFAAQSVLAEAMSMETGEPSQSALEQAQGLAEKALEVDESHIHARLQLAISLSLQARPMSNRQVRRSGLGQRAKALADEVVQEDAGNVYARGLLAVWNVEVLRRGGRIGGRIMGASINAGRTHYETGAALTPDDGALHWQWARVLAATNPGKYRSEIDAALSASVSANTDDALEGVMQARAMRLRELMATAATPREIKAAAKEML